MSCPGLNSVILCMNCLRIASDYLPFSKGKFPLSPPPKELLLIICLPFTLKPYCLQINNLFIFSLKAI